MRNGIEQRLFGISAAHRRAEHPVAGRKGVYTLADGHHVARRVDAGRSRAGPGSSRADARPSGRWCPRGSRPPPSRRPVSGPPRAPGPPRLRAPSLLGRRIHARVSPSSSSPIELGAPCASSLSQKWTMDCSDPLFLITHREKMLFLPGPPPGEATGSAPFGYKRSFLGAVEKSFIKGATPPLPPLVRAVKKPCNAGNGYRLAKGIVGAAYMRPEFRRRKSWDASLCVPYKNRPLHGRVESSLIGLFQTDPCQGYKKAMRPRRAERVLLFLAPLTRGGRGGCLYGRGERPSIRGSAATQGEACGDCPLQREPRGGLSAQERTCASAARAAAGLDTEFSAEIMRHLIRQAKSHALSERTAGADSMRR